MRFWCSALKVPWSWTWRPYVGVWLLCAGLLLAYGLAVHRRHRTTPIEPDSAKRTAAFVGGIACLWVATDWPIGTLGAGYLASVHMVQYMIVTLGAAPLLVVGIPEWMARRILGKLRLYRIARFVCKPLVAALLFNAILIATNVPLVVDLMRSNQLGSFALDMTWLLSGLILWMPVCSAIPEISNNSYPVKMAYLFLAAATVPMVPGGFLTFADYPLYRTYELAPRIANFSALNDQQLAGAFMKVGNIPLVWTVIAVMCVRWWRAEHRIPGADYRPRPAGSQGFAAPGSGSRQPGQNGYVRPLAPKPNQPPSTA